jgi:hypothetical protein
MPEAFSGKPALFAALMALPALCSCGSMAGSGAAQNPPKVVALDPMLAGKKLAETTFRGTIVAFVRQPITSSRQGIAVAWHRSREIVAGNLPQNAAPVPEISETPGNADFERLLDRKGFPEPENGTLKWLVDGPGFFPELDRQIAAARESIRAQV